MTTKQKVWGGWAVGVLMLATNTSAESFRFQCTAPLQNNAGSCVSPVLSSAPALDSIWVIFRITGPNVARRDSVWRRPGGTIALSYNFPRGTYTVEATALRKSIDGSLHYSCPAQLTAPTQSPAPWRPTFGP